MKRDGRLKGESEQFLPKGMDLVPQSTSLISPHVKSAEETGDDCPVTVRGSQTLSSTLNCLFPPGRGSFHQACKKALYSLPVCCLSSVIHCFAFLCFLNGRSKSQHKVRDRFRKNVHFQWWDSLQQGELTWPGPAAISDPTSPV